MPYITREDGEHFVIPSYRDVLTAKQKNQLKKEILLLSQSYGEYITLQKKSSVEYEVAFSPDTGYLLGESIWHYFKRPLEMIYCEAIPNTTEAILVIVKAGSVYLDGSFPIDSIAEELIIFLTQQNNFEIYTYGDVPISQVPETGKFSFEASSVKSFTVLDSPVFPNLPLLKVYQLQLVENVLKAQGIGVFPARQLLTFIIAVGALWLVWSYFTSREAPPPAAPSVNPYDDYYTALSSPDPKDEVKQVLNQLSEFATLPGWKTKSIHYEKGEVTAVVVSNGGTLERLFDWVAGHKMKVNVKKENITITNTLKFTNRSRPTQIYEMKNVLAQFIDNLVTVYPGNNLVLVDFANKGSFTVVTITINLREVTPLVITLIAEQFKNLPLVLNNINLDTEATSEVTGTISIQALGS